MAQNFDKIKIGYGLKNLNHFRLVAPALVPGDLYICRSMKDGIHSTACCTTGKGHYIARLAMVSLTRHYYKSVSISN